MFQVGISIGSDKKLKDILSSIQAETLIGASGYYYRDVELLRPDQPCSYQMECVRLFGGRKRFRLLFIILHLDNRAKEPTLGAQLAAELGTIALIANIIREIFALLGAPLFVRYFGRLSPICAGGATTMDTTLPIITRYCGKDLVFVSIFHGDLGRFHGSVFRIFLLFDVSERGFRDLGNHLARLKSHFRGLGKHFARLKSRFRGLEGILQG